MRVPDPPRYCAYLLRCWAEPIAQRERPTIWRFSLEDPHTGEQRGFATFELLVAFLRAELRDASLGVSSRQD